MLHAKTESPVHVQPLVWSQHTPPPMLECISESVKKNNGYVCNAGFVNFNTLKLLYLCREKNNIYPVYLHNYTVYPTALSCLTAIL